MKYSNVTILGKFRYVFSLVALYLTLVSPSIMAQINVPFAVRFTANEKGDIQIFGNTLMTCPAGGCAGKNNDYNMRYVDIDGNGSTINSSSADYTLPPSSTVLWAGLYWNGISSASSRNTCLFKTPGASGYTSLTGITYDNSYGYQGFKDVTTLVKNAGSGTYQVANVQSTTGTNTWAGWALVVVYRDPAKPQRNLTVFDGQGLVSSSDPNVNITISGFTTPLFGPVNVGLGVVAYDGDATLTGDAFKLNGTTLSNSLNPADNFFNSSITRFNTALTAKNPNYENQLGLDIDVIDATGCVANGATSATINLTTGGESYIPGVVTTAIDLYAPDININKSFVDLNGGAVNPGDTLKFTIVVKNDGQDGATNVVLKDSILNYLTFVPGSLNITAGANSGIKTNASGDDQAEFSNGNVIFRLGTGATASAGGSLIPAASSTVTFLVVVNNPLPSNLATNNMAVANYKSQSAPIKDYSSQSPLVPIPIVSAADLALTKTVSNITPAVGSNIVYTIALKNNGPQTATGVTVNEQLPLGLSYVSSTANAGSYDNVTGIWTVGSILNGATDTLLITTTVTGSGGISNTAEVKSSDQTDPNSTPNNGNAAENDQASVLIQPVSSADLRIHKAVSPAAPAVGDSVFYTISVKNFGPGTATNVIINDQIPSGISYLTNVPSTGTYTVGTGIWHIPSIALNATSTLQLIGTKTTPLPITNIAQITGGDQVDPNSGDNKDSVVIPIQIADLSITKTVNPTAPQFGQNATFTITVKNNGPSTATGIYAQDTLPSSLTYISSSTTKGVYNNINGEWAIGALANGDSCILTINTTVSSSDAIVNVAKITASHEIDPTLGDRTATLAFTSSSSNLSVVKTCNNPSPADGAVITYTVTVSNSGPSTSTGSTLCDVLPSGLILQSSHVSQGSLNVGTGTWTIGSIPAGSSATLTMDAKVVLDSLSSTVIDLGPAKPYNLFVLHDLNQPSSDTEGKVAVGHDCTLSGYSVGYVLPDSHGTEDVLVVGHDLQYYVGGVYGGNVVYGHSSNLPINPVSILHGTVRKDSIIDFPAAQSYLQNLSASLSTYPTNTTCTYQWGGLDLEGSNPYLNVFHVSGNLISHSNTVIINVPNGSAVLLNIDSTDVNWMGGLFVNGTAMSNVLYNFYEADNLNIHGIDITGSLLAPFATLTYPAGVMHGQVICMNMTGSGQFNNVPFVGNVPVNKDIKNVAELMTANEFDPNSTPGNGNPDEDDYSYAQIHVTNIVPSPKVKAGNWDYVANLENAPLILSITPESVAAAANKTALNKTNTNKNLLATTVNGNIFRSTDTGKNWTKINAGLDNVKTVWSVLTDISGKFFAATEQGLFVSTDSGVNWVMTTLNGKDVRAVLTDNAGTIYAGTWGSGVLKSVDAGASWTQVNDGLANTNVTSLTFSPDKSLYAGTFGGGAFKLADASSPWKKLSIADDKIWTVHATKSNELYASSYGNGVFVSLDNGATWSKALTSSNTKYIYNIQSDNANNVYMISTTGGIFVKVAATNTWKNLGLGGFGVSSIYLDETDGSVFIGTSSGYVYKNDATLTGTSESSNVIPTHFNVSQNYPNPFNPSTQISYDLPKQARVKLIIYDLLGKEVTKLVDETKEAGRYTVTFNAAKYASGLYFYKVTADNYSSIKKMILIK